MSENTNNTEMQVLLKEIRDLVEDGSKDVVRTDQIERMKSEFETRIKSVEDLAAAANAPSEMIKTDADEMAVKAFIHYANNGDKVTERGADGRVYVKTVGDQASLGVNAEGGYGLPKIFNDLVDSTNRKSSPLRQMARVVQSGMGFVTPIKITHGSAGARAETAALTSSAAPTYNTIAHTFFEVNAEELVTVWAEQGDATGIDIVANVLSDILQSLGEMETQEFLIGTNQNVKGSGGTVYNGLLSQTKLVSSVTRDTNTIGSLAGCETAAHGAVTADDVLNALYLLHDRYGANPDIMTSRELIKMLITAKDSEGRYILTMGNAADAPGLRTWGSSLRASDHFVAPADAVDEPLLVTGDFARSVVIADAAATKFMADPFTDKRFIKHLGRRRTSSSIVNYNGLRGLYMKAAS